MLNPNKYKNCQIKSVKFHSLRGAHSKKKAMLAWVLVSAEEFSTAQLLTC